MARTPKLTELQMILLSTASARADGSFLPLPASIADAGDRARKAVPALIEHALATERPVLDLPQMWREAEGERFGMFITDAGRALIDGTTAPAAGGRDEPAAITTDLVSAPSRTETKTETVLGLLNRVEGATSAELIEATGWLPHTMRAALTGLRKKGHAIERTKRDDQTCYRIAGQA